MMNQFNVYKSPIPYPSPIEWGKGENIPPLHAMRRRGLPWQAPTIPPLHAMGRGLGGGDMMENLNHVQS